MIIQVTEIVLIVVLCFYGMKCTFIRKDVFMLFFWMINMYQSLMAATISFGYLQESTDELWKIQLDLLNNSPACFIHIIFLCNLSFSLVEYYLKQKTNQYSYDFSQSSFEQIENNHLLFKVLLLVFFVSGGLYFLTYVNMDYSSFNRIAYNSNKFITRLMQVSSCVVFYLVYKRKWFLLGYFFMLFMVLSMRTTVRSLLYIVMLPTLTYYLMQYWQKGLDFKRFAKVTLLLFFLGIGVGVYMSFDKMGGVIMLPDAELSTLALNALNKYNFEMDGYRTFDTIINFFHGLLGPFMGILATFGLNFENPVSFSYVSAALMKGETDLTATVGEWHCPSTIYLDFYVSWGWAFPIFCVLNYFLFVYVFRWINKRPILVVLLSYQLMLFLYFFIRGAVDTASGTLSYPLIYIMIIYSVLSSKKQTIL